MVPPGTADPAHTFAPNPTDETPTTASAADTLTGATSADTHKSSGAPGSGQSSKELHDNSGSRSGLEGTGAKHAVSAQDVESNKKDFTTPVAGATQKKQGGDSTSGTSDDVKM